jgi:hypothetical protein
MKLAASNASSSAMRQALFRPKDGSTRKNDHREAEMGLP